MGRRAWVLPVLVLGLAAGLVRLLVAPAPPAPPSGDEARLARHFPGLASGDLGPLTRCFQSFHPHGPADRQPRDAFLARLAMATSPRRVVVILLAALDSPSPYARHDAALLLSGVPGWDVATALQARLPDEKNVPVQTCLRFALAQHGVDVRAHTLWMLERAGDPSVLRMALGVHHPDALLLQDAYLAEHPVDGAVAADVGWELRVREEAKKPPVSPLF